MNSKQELNELVKEKESKVVDKHLSDNYSSDKKNLPKARDWSSLNLEEYQ